MNCEAAETLVNALVDGELDAGHARVVENSRSELPALRSRACRHSRPPSRDGTARLAL